MSTPLAIFQQIWAECIPADVLPYVEAVNRNVDTNTLPEEWGAAILQPEARTDVTLGSMPWVEESGTFLIGLFTRSGSGPAALDEAVDTSGRPSMARAAMGLSSGKSTGRTTSTPRASASGGSSR
jgi:hypothetical protein